MKKQPVIKTLYKKVTLFLAYFNAFSHDFFNKYIMVCKLTVYFTCNLIIILKTFNFAHK
jgi:hypothetical protein